jgi:hypothetical protein
MTAIVAVAPAVAMIRLAIFTASVWCQLNVRTSKDQRKRRLRRQVIAGMNAYTTQLSRLDNVPTEVELPTESINISPPDIRAMIDQFIEQPSTRHCRKRKDMPYIKPKTITAEQAIAILKSERLWYPMASDLELPDVPWDAREDVRAALSFLGKVPIQTRDGSWLIAQAITELANSPRVRYAEGLMSVKSGNKVTPGAWHLVDGHIVSLFSEVSNRFKSEVWLYEPLKIYPLAEIYAARKAGHPCSVHEWRQTVVGTPDYNILEKVFNVPLQRMLERKQTDHKLIDLDWN